MRSRAALGVGCALLLVLGGCGSAVRSGHVTRAPADLSKGFASVEVPLPNRQSPMVVAAGNHVVVFGGYRIAGGREMPRGDGADYDVVKGEWTQMRPAPFDRPLHLAAGVWTGSEVIVVGTPCGTIETPDEIYEAQCDRATIAAAAYTPKTNSWRPLPAPNSSLLPGLAPGYPLLGVGAGSTGTTVLFYNDTGDASSEFLLADANGGHWRFLPAFPTADVVCPVAGAIVAVETGEVAPDGVRVSPNPRALRAPLQVSTLDVVNNSWGAPISTSKPAAVGAMSEQVVCAAGQLAYFPTFASPFGLDRGALWYEPASHRWNEVPSIGATNSSGPNRIATLHGTRVVSTIASPGSDATLFVLPAGARAWTRHRFPSDALLPFQALDDLILVVAADQRGSGHLTIGLLDPDRLPAASE